MTDLERERRALELFDAMLDIAPGERRRWLSAQTSDDPQLRRRVTRLEEADRANDLCTGGAFERVEEVAPPERVGAYRLGQLIGSGGMGSVYAGHRERGDFEHDVAIKLIKPGLLSDALADRFLRERQVLARFSHPHIARLFDGGETDRGQPYIVMERVEGVPLAQWLGEEGPDLHRRLKLFLQVCDAVAHAHRHLVVHRDLTPANILVDRDGDAKLIDFGISRLDGEEVGRSAQPLHHATLTPGYAAPERLRGEPAMVASDVYSAGKLLAAMLPRPSLRELAAIVSRATADDPDRRYVSIDRLADDVRRFADGYPVLALPAGRAARMAKWARRNRVLAATGAALVVAVAAGTGATAWKWRDAEAARSQAEQRFGETRGIARFMLYDLYDELDGTPGNTRALAHIADEASDYLARLAAVEDPSPQLRLEIAQGYHRLSTVSGNPEGSNLGRRGDARRFIDRAIADLEALHLEYPQRAEFTRALASAYYSDAILRFIGEDDNEGALRSGDRSAAHYARLARATGTADDRIAAMRSRLEAAKPLAWLERADEGVARLTRLRREVRAEVARDPGNRELARLLAAVSSEFNITSAWAYQPSDPRFAAGIVAADEAVAIYRSLIATAPRPQRHDLQSSLLAALYQRAQALGDAGRWRKSLDDLDEAIALAEAFIRADPDDAGAERRRQSLQSQKVYALIGVGRTGEAVAMSRSLSRARVRKAARNRDNPGYARDAAGALTGYAEALESDGRRAESCRAFAAALDAWRTIDARWPLSANDRQGHLADTKRAVAACRR